MGSLILIHMTYLLLVTTALIILRSDLSSVKGFALGWGIFFLNLVMFYAFTQTKKVIAIKGWIIVLKYGFWAAYLYACLVWLKVEVLYFILGAGVFMLSLLTYATLQGFSNRPFSKRMLEWHQDN